jgi:hypothetical protein
LSGITDTQRAAKLLKRSALQIILPATNIITMDPRALSRTITTNMAFDTDLLRLVKSAGLKIAQIPLVWEGSPEESTLISADKATMLKELLKQRQRWRKSSAAAERLLVNKIADMQSKSQ